MKRQNGKYINNMRIFTSNFSELFTKSRLSSKSVRFLIVLPSQEYATQDIYLLLKGNFSEFSCAEFYSTEDKYFLPFEERRIRGVSDCTALGHESQVFELDCEMHQNLVCPLKFSEPRTNVSSSEAPVSVCGVELLE